MSASVFLSAPISELLKRIKNDPQGVIDRAGKDVFVGRAPGRLDVMGGIADYTGAVVCEMPLDVGAAVAVQHRTDRKLVLKTYNGDGGTANGGAVVEISLDDFYGTAALLPYEMLQKVFAGEKHWAAYVAGAFPILAKYKKLRRRAAGANIACYSTVPVGGGVASSAALACATLSALTAANHLILEPLETAVLAQKVENHIAGAPCGVMDPVTSMLGRADELLILKCQPHELRGYVAAPAGTGFFGINSGVKHHVGGAAYRETRVAAFMAHAIIARAYRDLSGKANAKDPMNGYLANVSQEIYLRYFRPILPETITGEAFANQYGQLPDRVTTAETATTYYPRAAADHHVMENVRAQKFAELLKLAGSEQNQMLRSSQLMFAGELMVLSHKSYSENAQLGCPETDLLVELVMQRGVNAGFYGARVNGGGSGGTVAVFAQRSDAVTAELAAICTEYKAKTGLEAQILAGSSAGASHIEPVKVGASEI